MDDFPGLVQAQVELLELGCPIEALDLFCHDRVQMFDNDEVFATSKADGRARQVPFIAIAKNIQTKISDLKVDVDTRTSVFRNRTSFQTPKGETKRLEGIHWQRWENNLIVEERYFRGELMEQKVREGLLDLD